MSQRSSELSANILNGGENNKVHKFKRKFYICFGISSICAPRKLCTPQLHSTCDDVVNHHIKYGKFGGVQTFCTNKLEHK